MPESRATWLPIWKRLINDLKPNLQTKRGFLMKRSLPFFILSSIFFVAAPLATLEAHAQIDSIVVAHFVNASGGKASPDFIQYFYDSFRSRLEKDKVSNQVVNEGTVVSGAAAANSIVIEGKFTGQTEGTRWQASELDIDLSFYRISDHVLVSRKPMKIAYLHSPRNTDKSIAEYTGTQTAYQLRQTLKSMNPSVVAAAAPATEPAAPTAGQPTSGTAPSGPDAVASVQLSSDPAGAEITIDGNYVGSTPSQKSTRLNSSHL